MRLFHCVLCLLFGFLGLHRFFKKQKLFGSLFLVLSAYILIVGLGDNPVSEANNSVIIAIFVVTLLWIADLMSMIFRGRYVLEKLPIQSKTDKSDNFASSKQLIEEDSDMFSNSQADNVESFRFEHRLMAVRTGKSLSSGKDIYDACRYAWRVSADKLPLIEYVLAVDDGKIIGVFKPTKWLKSDDPEFEKIDGFDKNLKRWGFIGEVATSEILLLYFGKHISDMRSVRGASNPVRFFGDFDVDSQLNEPTTLNEIKQEDMPLNLGKVYRVVITRSEEPQLNMAYIELYGDEYEVLGAFRGICGGGGLFHQSSDGTISVSDDLFEFTNQSALAADNLEIAFKELEGFRTEFEEYDEEGNLIGLSQKGLEFITVATEDDDGYLEAYSEGASDDFIYDIQDEWNLDFYKD